MDADQKFTWVDVEGTGHQSAAQEFNGCELKEHLEDGVLSLPAPVPLPNEDQDFPYFFMGDVASPLTSNMMKPHSRIGLFWRV